MSNKIDRALHGPSWMEVFIGAALAVLIGVVLAAVSLIFRPVAQVRELPKEPERDTVYYIEGSHDSAKARRSAQKEKLLAAGRSVELNEDEINQILTPAAPPPPKGGKQPPAPETPGLVSAGAVNARIHGGSLQLAVPVRLFYPTFGVDATVLVLSNGTFVKSGDGYAYEPESLYLGSCPVQRIPGAAGFVMGRFLASDKIPAALTEAWGKLANVTIEGSVLKLTMPGS
ncbi:MAG: hypothetical protein JSR48_13510 [Verrucomicrobia bacterium]|nr:hypothetical protein [Verrucomicrobiota bacterium]